MSQSPSTTALERVQAFLRLVEHDKAGAVFHYGHELSVADLKEAIGKVQPAMNTAPPTEQGLQEKATQALKRFDECDPVNRTSRADRWAAAASACIAYVRGRSTLPSRPQGEEERCTCRFGRDHDGSEFGPCEHCEEQARRHDLEAAELSALRRDAERWRFTQLPGYAVVKDDDWDEPANRYRVWDNWPPEKRPGGGPKGHGSTIPEAIDDALSALHQGEQEA